MPVRQFSAAVVVPEQLRPRDREAVLGITDGDVEQGGEAELAVPIRTRIVVGPLPRVDGARGRHGRTGAPQRDRALIVWEDFCGLADAREHRVAAAVVGDDPDRIAADAAEVRIGHGNDGADRDRRLHRVAAVAQHPEAGFARQGMRARDHAASRDGERRASGRRRLGGDFSRGSRRHQELAVRPAVGILRHRMLSRLRRAPDAPCYETASSAEWLADPRRI